MSFKRVQQDFHFSERAVIAFEYASEIRVCIRRAKRRPFGRPISDAQVKIVTYIVQVLREKGGKICAACLTFVISLLCVSKERVDHLLGYVRIKHSIRGDWKSRH